MDAHAGAVDHLDVAIMRRRYGIHDPVPDAGLRPAAKAIVAGGVRPVAFRQVRPRSAAAQDPEDAVQNAPVIHARNTA